jgi:hypothetical protein
MTGNMGESGCVVKYIIATRLWYYDTVSDYSNKTGISA